MAQSFTKKINLTSIFCTKHKLLKSEVLRQLAEI
jgi:hypothetical protein